MAFFGGVAGAGQRASSAVAGAVVAAGALRAHGAAASTLMAVATRIAASIHFSLSRDRFGVQAMSAGHAE